MKRVLVTGANGTLGLYIGKLFKNEYRYTGLGKKELDVTDIKQVGKLIRLYKPDIIIHLAAITNVDKCEKFPKKTYLVNTQGTKNIVDICRKENIILVFLSSSAIFPGQKKGYTETDIPNPINVYGKSKLEAENYIKENLKKFFIVRTGWIIGGGKKEKKFVSFIINDILSGRKIKVVNDKFGTLAYAKNLAEFLKIILENNLSFGTYHFGSKGVCSRLDIATQIAKIFKKETVIQPVSSNNFKESFFAPRPKFEVLKSTKIPFRSTWKNTLKQYLQDEFI